MEELKGNLSLEEYHPCCLLSERRCKNRPLRPPVSVLHVTARLFPSAEGEHAGCLGRVIGSHLEGNPLFPGGHRWHCPSPKSLEDETFIQGSGRRIPLKGNQVYLLCAVKHTWVAPYLKV